ncbi:Dimer-Tnp-hAT domain-containing protein [Mycena venus]|uniref:Dimer-Tnp-hAT domain-containing protein n=1 Tax=Mycena venus TaxID=2733690 RepID=A0A8H6YQC8_9AGAR|nr:Dimer-Tnp-hAT domain-containing protein [Mycena venus]
MNQFAITADESDEVPDLEGKNYADFKLTKLDWIKIRKMHEVLEVPAKIQQSFSSAKFPTVWRTLPLFEFLQQSWRNMAATAKFADMKDSIDRGLENLEKWYRKTEESDVYFICLALDPNYKTEYAEHQWDSEAFIHAMEKFKAKFDLYYKSPAIQASVSTDAESSGGVDPREELRAYISAPLENTDDHHSEQYPILFRMACDYLAIQGSATASERAFSSGALTATRRRNRLSPEMFEALQLLKSAYRNGHIEASEEARNRVIDFLDVFDGDLDDTDKVSGGMV